MNGDKMIWEGLRIAERIVSAESLRPAGEVFPRVKKKIRIRSRKRRPSRYRRVGAQQPNDKLHKLANWYRPKEQE